LVIFPSNLPLSTDPSSSFTEFYMRSPCVYALNLLTVYDIFLGLYDFRRVPIGDEYIIATFIPGYTSIPGGVTNRAAIDYAGQRGDFHLQGYRMAKLNKPLRLFDRQAAIRAAGGASFSSSEYPDESVGIIPVPLK
jgi:hypothetical protein